MKKLDGNFIDKAQYDLLESWRQTAKSNNETFELSLPQNNFKEGFIIIDETTPHGTSLFTSLTTNGWTEDVSYIPNKEDLIIAQREAEKQQKLLDMKTEQDNINETVNRPNIINDLDNLDYNELDKITRDVLPFDQLVDYHSNMVKKQNIIKEVIKIKEIDDIKENWDIEGLKTKTQLETELKTLKAVKE